MLGQSLNGSKAHDNQTIIISMIHYRYNGSEYTSSFQIDIDILNMFFFFISFQILFRTLCKIFKWQNKYHFKNNHHLFLML